VPCPALTTWVTCLGVLFCPVFSSSSVTDLTTRQRIHHLEFLQLNRRAVVIGVIVIVWFLRVCDNLCPLRLCDLVDPATKISQDSQRPSRLTARAKIIPWTVDPTFEVCSQRCSVSGKEHCSVGVYFHVFKWWTIPDSCFADRLHWSRECGDDLSHHRLPGNPE